MLNCDDFFDNFVVKKYISVVYLNLTNDKSVKMNISTAIKNISYKD